MERDSYAHIGGPIHIGFTHTLTELKKHLSMNICDHQISSAYVKAVIDVFCCQLIQKATLNDTLGTSLRKYDTTTSPTKVIDVEARKTNNIVAEIQIKYATCLQKRSSKRVTCSFWYLTIKCALFEVFGI